MLLLAINAHRLVCFLKAREFHSGAVTSKKQFLYWFPKFKQKAGTKHTGHQALLYLFSVSWQGELLHQN